METTLVVKCVVAVMGVCVCVCEDVCVHTITTFMSVLSVLHSPLFYSLTLQRQPNSQQGAKNREGKKIKICLPLWQESTSSPAAAHVQVLCLLRCLVVVVHFEILRTNDSSACNVAPPCEEVAEREKTTVWCFHTLDQRSPTPGSRTRTGSFCTRLQGNKNKNPVIFLCYWLSQWDFFFLKKIIQLLHLWFCQNKSLKKRASLRKQFFKIKEGLNSFTVLLKVG